MHRGAERTGDVVDQYAETLCEGSDTKYRYNGECRDMEPFFAGELNGDPVHAAPTALRSLGYLNVGGAGGESLADPKDKIGLHKRIMAAQSAMALDVDCISQLALSHR